MVVSAAEPLGDVTCPHCGVLSFPNVDSSIDVSDDEFKLSEKGIFVETNDEGEIVLLFFKGSQFNDETLHLVMRFDRVPIIDVSLTQISNNGLQKLRNAMRHTTIVADGQTYSPIG